MVANRELVGQPEIELRTSSPAFNMKLLHTKFITLPRKVQLNWRSSVETWQAFQIREIEIENAGSTMHFHQQVCFEVWMCTLYVTLIGEFYVLNTHLIYHFYLLKHWELRF